MLSRAGEQTASVAICCQQENWLAGAPCQGVAELQHLCKPSHPWNTHAGGTAVNGCKKLWVDARLLSISCDEASSVWSSCAMVSALPSLGMELYIFPIPSSSFMVKKFKKKKKTRKNKTNKKIKQTKKSLWDLETKNNKDCKIHSPALMLYHNLFPNVSRYRFSK